MGTVIELTAGERDVKPTRLTCETCDEAILTVEPLLSSTQMRILVEFGDLSWDTPTYVIARPCGHVLPKPDRRFYANQ